MVDHDDECAGQTPRLHQPFPEILEDRQLLTASLQPIPNLTVPAQLGYQLALDGSGNTDPGQTYTVSSSNPDVQVSVAQGQFWTITVSHTAANSSDVTINHESMTFQLFGDLTPQTVARITTLTNDNYYTTATLPNSSPAGPGKYIPRITSVASSGFSVIQGGSSSPTSTSSSSGLTPIATEPVQQLAFTGQYQIAMANTGAPDSTDAQFFITNGVLSASAQQAFDFNYTIFGQLVSGQQTLTDLSKVAVRTTPLPAEDSQPITPVVINSVALSSTNPNGVLHIDTTSARAGETATITVTATDPSDGTHVTQNFDVTVSAYNGPTDPVINFRPFANPTTATTNENHPTTIQLAGQSGYPDSSTPGTLSYTIVTQPAHGTVSQFNPATGSLVYTPDPGYYGPDSFQYHVQATGPQSEPGDDHEQSSLGRDHGQSHRSVSRDSHRRERRAEQQESGDADRDRFQRPAQRVPGRSEVPLSAGFPGLKRVLYREERAGRVVQETRVQRHRLHGNSHARQAVRLDQEGRAPDSRQSSQRPAGQPGPSDRRKSRRSSRWQCYRLPFEFGRDRRVNGCGTGKCRA